MYAWTVLSYARATAQPEVILHAAQLRCSRVRFFADAFQVAISPKFVLWLACFQSKGTGRGHGARGGGELP